MNAEQFKIHHEKMQNDPKYKEEYFRKRKEEQEKHFFDRLDKIDRFETHWDVPNIPEVEKELFDKLYVPKLIEKGAIPKIQLQDGKWYYGNFRNSNFGKWDAEKERFGHWRMKFGWMWDHCEHFEDDRGFALFVPIREATTEEVEEQEKIGRDTESHRKPYYDK